MTPYNAPQREARPGPRRRVLAIGLGCVLWLGVVGAFFAVKFHEFTRVRGTTARRMPPPTPPPPRPQFPQLPAPSSRQVVKGPTPAELETKARAGDAAAALALARLLEQRNPAEPASMAVAFEWRLRAAEAGDGLAMAGVARAYRKGIGVARDAVLAESWTERAIAAGGAELWDRIGMSFRVGLNVPEDAAEAAAWYRRAVEKGRPSAQGDYATLLLQGRGVAKDVAAARSLLESAVDAGDVAAMVALAGTLTQHAPTDWPRARRLYQRAAKQHSLLAINRHGLFCQNGIGGPRDLATARQEFKLASELGSNASLMYLAAAMFESDAKAGLLSDPVEARRLLEEAAAKNYASAKAALAKVAGGSSLREALGLGVENSAPAVEVDPQSAFDAGRLDSAPRVVLQTRPRYPFALRVLGVGGQVVVDFLVDREGQVQNAYAIRSTVSGFESAAVEAVSGWQFEPGRKNGAAVITHMQVPIVFTLDEVPSAR